MKYNILHGLLLIFGIFAGLNAAAQTRVSGTVKDSKGEPVIGAVVMLQGSSSIGSTTDLDGKYTLTIPASVKKPVLVASCISYVTQDIETGGRTVIDIVLQEDAEELEEVVVVGYGSMRKSDLTGSVSSVKIDESKAARSATIDQLLQGHAAGVQVLNNSASPDGGVSIRIRGLSSFNGSSEPLYVVDGIIINGDSSSASLLSAGADNSDSGEEINGLMGLNPQDIASMEILKDASATAIYGALGANGVVLITTKSATKDRPSVRFNAGVDYRTPAKKADILSFDEFCNFIGDKFDRNIGSNIKTYAGNIFNDPSGRTGIKVFGIDWQDKIMRNAFGQRYHLSISGRPKSFSYAFSLGYSDNQGIVKSTGVKQYTIRLNLDKNLSNRLKIGTRTNVAFVNSTMTQSTGGGRMTSATSAIRSMLSFRPYTTVNTEADNYDEEDDDLRSSPELWINPHHFSNSRKEYRITPSVYATYTIVKGLTFDSKLGGDYRNTEQQKFKSSRINTTTEGSNGATSTVERFTWNWDNMLTYKKKIKGHNINATIGSSSRDNLSTSQTVQGWNIEQYRSGIGSINAAPNSSLSYTESESQTLSFFARGVYSYRDRYVLTATYRADGSSKFQGSNKWAFFPSFAFAWRLSQEPWFKVPKVSSAKLRLGWGRVGNQSISNYQTMSTYGNARLPDHAKDNPAESLVAVYPNNLSNPDLKWETTEQVNAGLDLGLWKGRLTFTADLYYKRTFDLLQSKQVPTSSGFSSIWVNEGTIDNRGLELTVEATPLKTSDFEWNLSGNISFNRNKIVKISDEADRKSIVTSLGKPAEEVVYFLGNSLAGSNYCIYPGNIFMEGYPMGLFYGWKVKGIVGVGQTGTPASASGEPVTEGMLDYYDLNGNGYIDDDDRTIIGNPNPSFTFGFGTSITWKRLSLSMDFNGSWGNDIININRAVETDTYSGLRNVLRGAYFKAWTPDNTATKYPGLGMVSTNDTKKVSSFYVEDGSYLRLASLSLSYDVPIKDNNVLKGMTIAGTVNNVFVLTRYEGWDPDVNSFGSNIKKMGCDSGSYPGNRAFSFDVKLTF